jgi:hypothetical protein
MVDWLASLSSSTPFGRVKAVLKVPGGHQRAP